MTIPTPIAASLQVYNKHKDGLSGLQKYKALEATYQALIKYLSITVLLIARDRNSEVYSKAAFMITENSSLGGWVNAMNCVFKELTFDDENDPAQAYMNYFKAKKKHPDKDKLSELVEILNQITGILNIQGYRFDAIKRTNILGIFSTIVEIRNKCAHGNISIVTYEKFIKKYELLLKEIVHLLPLDKFTLYGQYNNRSLCLEDINPILKDKPNKALFWVESELLENETEYNIPFMQFEYDTQEVFYLNDSVGSESERSEFINYTNGNVRYWKVLTPDVSLKIFSGKPKKRNIAKISIEQYRIIGELDGKWTPLPLAKNSLDLLPKKGNMIYVFCISPDVLGLTSYDMLYVGKSTNPKERFRDYLAIYDGFNVSRSEITAMFEKYENQILFVYYLLKPGVNLSKVESAFYNIFDPPYNLLAPPVVN